MFKTVISAATVAASGSYTSKPVSLQGLHENFSLYWEVTGDGTARFSYLGSPDGIHFVEDTGTYIASSQTKTSGPGSDGKAMDDFAPWPCDSMKIKVAETGGAETITVTAILCMRD